MRRPLILASRSPYRARLLAETGAVFEAESPDVDERALDDRFDELGPEQYALTLAGAKARAVAARLDHGIVIGGDQAAVLDEGGAAVLLHRPADREAAIRQLLRMSGTTHRLVNGLVVVDAADGRYAETVDIQTVTMNVFDESTAAAYVDEFAPYDCAGGYRLEDDAGLVARVDGEDPSGVVGLPLPALRRLLAELGAGDLVPPHPGPAASAPTGG